MYQSDYFYKTGWVCPKCGRVYSPDTSMCYNCNSGENKITFGTGTNEYIDIDYVKHISTTIPTSKEIKNDKK